ncbi:hypothetical protein ACQP3L_34170, partial [Escherichia coli]
GKSHCRCEKYFQQLKRYKRGPFGHLLYLVHKLVAQLQGYEEQVASLLSYQPDEYLVGQQISYPVINVTDIQS